MIMSGAATAPAQMTAVESARQVQEYMLDMWGKGLLISTAIVWAAGLVIGFTASLAIVAALGVVAMLVGIRVPGVGLIGIGLLCICDPVLRTLVMTGGVLRYNTFNYAMVFVAVMSAAELARMRSPQLGFALAFMIVQIVWLAFTAAPLEDAVIGVLNFASYFGLCAFFARASWSGKAWLWQAMIGGVAGAMGGGLFVLKQDGLPYVNHNVWSYLPLTAIFALSLALLRGRVDGRTRLTMQVLIMINAMWIFMSGSRGTMLVAVCCIVFMVIALRKESAGLLVALGLFILGIGISATTEQGSQSLARIEKLLNESEDITGRTSGRADLFKGGWILFTEHPLGVGTGSFMYAWKGMGMREDLAKTVAGQRKAAHSAWIATLVEQGLIGIGLFAPFILSFGWKGWMRRHQGLFLLGLWATLTLALSFTATEFASKGTWYLAAAATVMLQYPPLSGNTPPPAGREDA